MANRLAMDKVQAIKSLEAAGLSERQIASTLGDQPQGRAAASGAKSRQRIPKRPPAKCPPGRWSKRYQSAHRVEDRPVWKARRPRPRGVSVGPTAKRSWPSSSRD